MRKRKSARRYIVQSRLSKSGAWNSKDEKSFARLASAKAEARYWAARGYFMRVIKR
jgi:hypothetical protein